ncbi:MAG: DNA mismatch repair endonuclease MutL [Candidatus Dormibacteria bacterium]
MGEAKRGEIRRLEQVVADAIAAGEVVERPASVVKELVENALDAGAASVQVELDAAGLERILVVDDGRGIPPGELHLAFTRHATSKVASIDDLARITTLGFRGEALASIAAVSRVDFRTHQAPGSEGARLLVAHGVIGAVGSAPPVPGTRVEVRGLFENTPARRAFLRRAATEVGAVVRVLSAIALCHPAVRVRLVSDGRRLLDLAGDGNLEHVFTRVGRASAPLLGVAGSRGDVEVAGVVVEPSGLRRSREHLYLSINGRPISNRGLAFAVEQAYRGLAEPGLFPAGALDITLPPHSVDVNVHPTKREVRLRHDRAAFSVVQEAVVRALSGAAGYRGEGLLQESAPAGLPAEAAWPERVSGTAHAAPPDPATAVGHQQGLLLSDARGVYAGSRADASTAAPSLLARGPFRLVGQVMDSFIVAEGPAGLVVVDQHAAHERIVYNRLEATAGARQRQPLLVPIVLHLTPAQAACLDDCRDDLAAAGVEIEDFGAGAARLVAYDPVLPERRLDRLALEVLDTLVAEGAEVDLHKRLQRAMYTVACHSSVRFGQRLAREEMEELLHDLEVADPGITCPHGRPTFLEITESRLRREFKRSPT